MDIIKVSIMDNRGSRINAKLVDFQTVTRVDVKEDGRVEQEAIIFGICIGPTGHFYVRRTHEMMALNGEDESPAASE
jgi:hypothetical protein